jgi:nitrogen fixation protein NifX
MKIAFTSSTGEMIDQHFGQCQNFHIWEVGPDDAHFVTTISAITTATDEEDRIQARASALVDCAIVYTMQIGGPAAAKVIRAGVHPIKHPAAQPAREIVAELQRVLAAAPPPWLAKAMRADPDRRVRFASNDSP